MIFADSSFLVSLYLPNDRFSAAARTIAISFRDALLLEAKTFVSFDDRQRRLAAGVGLQLLPETLR